MKFKGKAKKAFESWYLNDTGSNPYKLFDWFYSLEPRMQYGPMWDWLSSVGIHISIRYNPRAKLWGFHIQHVQSEELTIDIPYSPIYKTPDGARTFAISAASTLFNRRK